MHFPTVAELLIGIPTVAAAVWGLYHQYGIIREQRKQISEQRNEIEDGKKEIGEQKREAQERRNEIHELQQEKTQYQKEIDDLRDIRNIKSLQLVEDKLRELKPPLCDICKHLLYLRVSTSLSGATKQFINLGKVTESNPRPRVDRRVLNALENAITYRLWQTPLEHDRQETEFIEQAIPAYTRIVSDLRGEELASAVRFCVEICCDGRAILQKEAVRTLLPKLLVVSNGDNELVQVYRKLLEGFHGIQSNDEKHLLVSIFGGLADAAMVASGTVTEVWELTFKAAIVDVAWAWGEKDGPNIGGPWCDAIEARLPFADSNEKDVLRKLISDYLVKDQAPQHKHSYKGLSRLLGGSIRPAIDPDAPGYRKVDRAVVKEIELPVEIMLAGSSLTITGLVVNFSLDLSAEKMIGRGMWAIADFNQASTEAQRWQRATVTILYPKGGRIVFEKAQVWGPLSQMANSKPFWGFRIQLGLSSPEDGITPLKGLWKDWPKR